MSSSIPPPSPLSRHVQHGRQTELPFHKIMDYLDNPSLLALGRVNHKLNRTALARILGPSIVEGLFTRSELTIGRRQPIELLSALCAARWLPSRIKSVAYLAARDDIHDFVRDMLGLALLLSQLSHGSLETLRLEISVNTTVSSTHKCEKEHQWPVTNLAWARALSNVVDAALFVGCSMIVVVTDYLPEFSLIEPFPPPSPPMSPSRTDIIGLLQTFMTSVSQNVLPPPNDALRIKSLTFATAHFMTNTLFSYTLSLFGRVSSTLQDLVFSSSPDYCYSSSTWATLFHSIRLPALKSLTFSFPKGASILPRDLFDFLSSHPTINYLQLDLSLVGFSIDSTLPTIEDPHGRSLLPNLQVLEAWPQFIPWLFPRGRKPSFTQRLSRTTTTPRSRMSTIRILTTDFLLKANSGMLLNHVILALNSCLSTAYPQNLSLSPSVALQMNFHDTYWYEWIWTNVTAPADSTNPLLTISKVSKLTLDIDSSVEASSKTRMDIPLIAEWLALFPVLLELEIVGNPFTEDALNEELCDAIALRCPNLRRLCCEGVIVSL